MAIDRINGSRGSCGSAAAGFVPVADLRGRPRRWPVVSFFDIFGNRIEQNEWLGKIPPAARRCVTDLVAGHAATDSCRAFR
jgi:hypothetical protein